MAAVYCEKHGRAVFEAMKSDKGDSEKGAFTKVVIGPIKADGCLCNQCNSRISPGDTAVYVSHHNRQYPDDRGEYGYMDMGSGSKKTYKLGSK